MELGYHPGSPAPNFVLLTSTLRCTDIPQVFQAQNNQSCALIFHPLLKEKYLAILLIYFLHINHSAIHKIPNEEVWEPIRSPKLSLILQVRSVPRLHQLTFLMIVIAAHSSASPLPKSTSSSGLVQ